MAMYQPNKRMPKQPMGGSNQPRPMPMKQMRPPKNVPPVPMSGNIAPPSAQPGANGMKATPEMTGMPYGSGMKTATDLTSTTPSAGGMKTPDAQGAQGAYDAAQASSAASMSGAQDAQMRILGALKNQFKKPKRMA